MYERALSAQLSEALNDTPVIFLAGARQSGKSTLVNMLKGKEGRNFTYRSFDDLGVLASAKADPEGFVASLGEHAVLDEIQRVPELLLPIKATVDRDRRPGRFILTGSANVLTLPKVSERLAGRMDDAWSRHAPDQAWGLKGGLREQSEQAVPPSLVRLTLWPLSQSELEGVRSGFLDACFQGHPQRLQIAPTERQNLIERVFRGGYPEVVNRTGATSRTRWFEAYLQTLIQRDVRDLASIEGLTHLPRLLQSVALRTGSPMNISDLGRSLGLNQMTLKRYLTLFENLFLLTQLPPWFENLGKRLAKTPKYYVNDAGLLAHLLGLDAKAVQAQPTAFGPILENFVVTELAKMAPWATTRPGLFHMRTSAGVEVDVVLENRRREVVGIEVKAAASISETDFKGLRMLQGDLGERMKCGVLLYTGREALPFGPGLWALPIQSLWGTGMEHD